MLYRLHRRVVILKATEDLTPKAFAAGAGEANVGVLPQNSSNSGAASEEPTTSTQAEKHFKDFGKPLAGVPKDEISPLLIDILKGKANPPVYDELEDMGKHEDLCGDVGASIFDRDLRPAWRESLNDESDRDLVPAKTPEAATLESLQQKYANCCADFIALHFCGFIAYAVAQVKRMAWALSVSLVLLTLLFNSYSPEGSQLIGRFLVVLFLMIGAAVWRVFSQMERNPILSAIAHTKAGELGGDFWVQLLALGGLPLLGVLGHLFPSASQFLFQWIAPSVQASR